MSITLLIGLTSITLMGQTADMREQVSVEEDAVTDIEYIEQQMEDDGFNLYLDVNSELWANTSGGYSTGSLALLQSQFGFDLDLGTLLELEGWSYGMDWHAYYGSEVSNIVGIGVATAVSSLEAQANVVRFRNIYLEHDFDAGRYVIRFGQLAADDTFMVTKYGSVFINSGFGALPAQELAVNAPVYPLSAPGAFFYARSSDELFMRLGIYTANAGQDVTSNWGFDWSISANDGAAIFYEIGTDQTLWGLPGTYTLGVFSSTGDVTLNTTGATDWGLAFPYIMLEQALITDTDDTVRLGAFFRFTTNFQPDRNTQNVYSGAGLAWYEPIPGREHDVAGLAFNYSSLESSFLTAQSLIGNSFSREQKIIELTYQVHVTDWLLLQPDFQIVLDPHVSQRDAWVVGIRASAVF